jgi:hypothetical protein
MKLIIEKIYLSLGSRSLCSNDRYGIVYYSQLFTVLILIRNCCDSLLPQVEKLENNTNIRRTFEQREQRDEYFGIFSNIYL